jgi:NDP-sugar pyrophosphorylase family protein
LTLPVAILAGGLATRLRPITETVPKALLDVAGEPFVHHQLSLLRARGIERVVLCVGHLGERVEAAVGDGARWGLRVACVPDGPRLLGTGGALRRALPLLGERFLVLYGDSFLDCDYLDVARAFVASGREGLMTVWRNEGRHDASNVVMRDGRIARYSKVERDPEMRWIDWGLGGLSARALARWPGDEPLDLATVYGDLVARGELSAYEVAERFYEIGSPAGLEETRRHLEERKAR